jgi:Leucine-rich repeat (LRR) protein
LDKLTISKNLIETLLDKFDSFKNLKTFSVSHNKLKEIPPTILKLQNLEFAFNNNLL